MFWMSAASTAETNVPRRGCTSTRFSSASRLTASRSGVRPMPSSPISASSRRTVPGGRWRVTIRSRNSVYARSATSRVAVASGTGVVEGSTAIAFAPGSYALDLPDISGARRPTRGPPAHAGLERLGKQRRNVHDAQPVAAGAHAVVEHHSAERTGHRQRLGAGLGGLAGALLVDKAAALLHPHVRTAGAAAEGALLAALHLDRRSDRFDDLARVGAHVVVARQVTGVVVGDRAGVAGGLERSVAHQVGQQLGVMDDLVVAAEVGILVAERVEAVRAAGHDLRHASLVQRAHVPLPVRLEGVLVAHPPRGVAGARLARSEDREVHAGRLEQLGRGLRRGPRALVEGRRAADPVQDLRRRVAGLQHAHAQLGGPVGALCLRLAPRVRGALDVAQHLLRLDRKSTRLNSSHTVISYAVFCLKKKKKIKQHLYLHIKKNIK